jgi:hypothetical protein
MSIGREGDELSARRRVSVKFRGRSRPTVGVALLALCAVLLTAAFTGSGPPRSMAGAARSASGPAADVSTELTGGQGVFIGSPIPVDLARAAYVQHESAAAGMATSYLASGPLGRDGRWALAPDARAAYRTRVLVRRPASRARFSGTVVVEWLNVSGGVDADPDWATLHEEILRRGDAWVGVSAQRIGVVGGPVLVTVNAPGAEAAGKGLVAIDPARYGSLAHPGDGFSFDIFTQVARALRSGGALGGLHPKRLIAAGESQSAFAMVTYYDGVQPLTHAFDGFFVHSRGAIGLPLVAAGQYADIAHAISGTPSIFRTDQAAPVMDVQTETDVASILDSYAARQPDSARFRLWEVPGTAHADAHLLGANVAYLDCGVPVNNGPLHVVAKAALHALETWLSTGAAPVHAARIDVVAGARPQIQRTADGIALGGVRTPPVDVPVAALSGNPGPNPSTICLLLGSTTPFPASRIAQLYPSRAAYLRRFTADADAAIRAGFVLHADRSALLGFADPSRVRP